MNFWLQNKGQVACAKAFLQAIKAGQPVPISFEELLMWLK
jgi:hypothetical protein